MIWWLLKRVLDIEHPHYYLGSLFPKMDEEIQRLKKEGAWSS